MTLLVFLYFVSSFYYGSGQYVLPSDVSPTNYDVKIIFDVDPASNFSYYGYVDILLHSTLPTSKIILNANGLHFLDKNIELVMNTAVQSENNVINMESVSVDTDNQLYTIYLKNPLEMNIAYSLSLAFYGNLSTEIPTQKRPGVYVVKYLENIKNLAEPRHGYAVATNFDPTGARTLFPCFDEPEFKAFFNLVIGHHRDYQCISNMPHTMTTSDETLGAYYTWPFIEKAFSKSREDFVWDHFETSRPMSSFLVGFVIFNYSRLESHVADSSTKINLWARPDVIFKAQYASELASDLLNYYNNFFNVPYELPKIDHVFHTQNKDVSSTSWGLINYSEVLLQDEGASLVDDRIAVTKVMSKEMALQWFGTFVTVRWWTELWLKDGFTTYLSLLSLLDILNKHRITETAVFLPSIMEVLDEDSVYSALQITVYYSKLVSLSQVNDYSKRIHDTKAAILFRMFHKFLGDAIFKDAVHNLLMKHSFGLIQQDDFWKEIFNSRSTVMTNFTDKSIMDSWTMQPGYPLITITRNYRDNSYSITQKRFLRKEDSSLESAGWWVPFQTLSEGDHEPSPLQWLANNEGVTQPVSFQLTQKTNMDVWMLFNVNLIAPCRVNYDTRNWQMLALALSDPKNRTLIPAMNRAQLLDDAFELAKSGYLDFALPFELANHLQNEMNPDVLEHGFNRMASIGMMFRRTSDYDIFEKHMQIMIFQHKSHPINLLEPVDRKNYQYSKLWLVLSEFGSSMNIDEYTYVPERLFKQWMASKTSYEKCGIAPELQKLSFCIGVERGNKSAWFFVLERLQQMHKVPNKMNVINALACTKVPWLLHRTLGMMVNGELDVTLGTNIDAIIKTVVRNAVGFYVGKDFLFKNSKEIFSGYAAQSMTIALIKNLLDQINDLSELDEFESWLESNRKSIQHLDLVESVNRSVDKARSNVECFDRSQDAIIGELSKYTGFHSVRRKGGRSRGSSSWGSSSRGSGSRGSSSSGSSSWGSGGSKPSGHWSGGHGSGVHWSSGQGSRGRGSHYRHHGRYTTTTTTQRHEEETGKYGASEQKEYPGGPGDSDFLSDDTEDVEYWPGEDDQDWQQYVYVTEAPTYKVPQYQGPALAGPTAASPTEDGGYCTTGHGSDNRGPCYFCPPDRGVVFFCNYSYFFTFLIAVFEYLYLCVFLT